MTESLLIIILYHQQIEKAVQLLYNMKNSQ